MFKTSFKLLLSFPALAACAIDENPRDEQRLAALEEPRMGDDVFHVGMHLYTGGDLTSPGSTPAEVVVQAREIKKMIARGTDKTATCYMGPEGRAQLAIQTEFTLLEYVKDPEGSLELLRGRLEALFDEGFAVHLLLPLHYEEVLVGTEYAHWQGVDWAAATNWSNSTDFVPMQPCPEAEVDGVVCPYDVVMKQFQVPVMQYLVENDLADKLAVVYVANEFGYDSKEIRDTSADWGGVANWHTKRAEALARTANRALGNARDAAMGEVPVGIKLIMVGDPETGWKGDQLAWLLKVAMAPNGDVLGYDVYFDNDEFDAENRKELSQYLPLFDNGRFEIAEFGRICDGAKSEFTHADDVTGAAAAWSTARGLNFFSYNGGNCYALTKANGKSDAHAQQAGMGLWSQIKAFTGTPNPTPCDEVDSCAPIVESVTPLDAALNHRQIFTVLGSCLPPSLAAWVQECEDLKFTSRTPTEARFECTPSWTEGIKNGEIRDKKKGSLLVPFKVDVATCTPIVYSTTPTIAQLGERQTFTVTGSCLPDTLAAWIHDCEDLVFTSRKPTKAKFECTPSWTMGSKPGYVKDEPGPGGKVLDEIKLLVD